MCGIIGYVGKQPAREVLLRGLERLEYRGYDSAGVSTFDPDGRFETVRAVGNLAKLRAAVAARVAVGAPNGDEDAGHAGIGHTRWATHGRVTEANAHPHTDTSEQYHIVLNGIVENHLELRASLEAGGAVFSSETDAEVVAHLIAAHHENGTIEAAVRRAYADLVGHYAFVVLCADEPTQLLAMRKECPLVVGGGAGEQFVASAAAAFLQDTNRVHEIADGELVVLSADGVRFADRDAAAVPAWLEVDWSHETAEKDGHPTFMAKEIAEQPRAVAETLLGRLDDTGPVFDDVGLLDEELADLEHLTIVACGTSYHAGLVGRNLIEAWARLPVNIDVASEYRYRDPLVRAGELLVGITQSGETADTLAAMRMARDRGARVLALTNVPGSQATRDADGALFTRAGVEIGVAATKTFTCQVAALAVLALKLAQVRGTLDDERIAELTRELESLPNLIEATIEATTAPTEAVAARWQDAPFFMFLGRHVGLPLALEGALKLKEIAYIPSDAYAAGEMKHGPIALLDERTPVVCLATDSPVLEKLLSNLAEVRARGAHVIAIASASNAESVGRYADDVIAVPDADWLLQPLLAAVPLQILALTIASRRGLNVDQPRNLAKTVTVE